jgi:17-hydroxy-3-oxo-4-pregnene-20-carboxyl-CoA lyase
VIAHAFAGKAAVAGVGATEFSKASGRSELRLATEAVDAALRDASVEPSEVQGMVTFSGDTNPDIDIARALGIGELTFLSRVHYGGGAALGVMQQAALAVASGVATTVVVYRAFNERSGNRFGGGVQNRPVNPTAENAQFSWYSPVGLLTPASWAAMFAQRYLHATGATPEAMGWVAIADRAHAATNPHAWFYKKPITMEEYLASRWIVEPLRLLDCCQETDGGQAVVVTSLERARDLPNPPAVIRATAQGSWHGQDMMTSYYRDDMTELPEMGLVARQLYQLAGIGPGDVQTAVLYDAFTPFVLYTIEEFGFCGRGEAKDFVKDGNIQLGGGLPVNTHGGQLGEGYLHGVNGIAEAVRQVRGTAVNQVEGVEHVVVTAGTGVPTSGMILGVDR